MKYSSQPGRTGTPLRPARKPLRLDLPGLRFAVWEGKLRRGGVNPSPMRSLTTAFRVRFGDTDAAGIVFYPNIFAYFDVAAHELLRACGYALGERLRIESIAFPIVESGARFRAPLHHDEEVAVTARVGRIGTSSLRLEYTIERDHVLAAEGFEVRVFVTLNGGRLRSAPLPADLRAALSQESSEKLR